MSVSSITTQARNTENKLVAETITLYEGIYNANIIPTIEFPVNIFLATTTLLSGTYILDIKSPNIQHALAVVYRLNVPDFNPLFDIIAVNIQHGDSVSQLSICGARRVGGVDISIANNNTISVFTEDLVITFSVVRNLNGR